MPASLVAVTMKVYVTPSLRPVTLQGADVHDAIRLSGLLVTL